MSPYAQAKILRAIESREVYRLGEKCRIPVNVRVLAATNHDLEQEVRIEVLMSQENEPMPISYALPPSPFRRGVE
jgi:DNA-binding NtrC family response regulator